MNTPAFPLEPAKDLVDDTQMLYSHAPCQKKHIKGVFISVFDVGAQQDQVMRLQTNTLRSCFCKCWEVLKRQVNSRISIRISRCFQMPKFQRLGLFSEHGMLETKAKPPVGMLWAVFAVTLLRNQPLKCDLIGAFASQAQIS